MIKSSTFSLVLSSRFIPSQNLRNIFGRKFDNQNHLVSTARQIIQNPDLDFRDSSLFHYHNTFMPASTNVAMELANLSRIYPVFEYPWGHFNLNRKAPKTAAKSRFCGPSSNEQIKAEFNNMKALIKSITEDGYQPILKRSLIFGTFVCRGHKKVFIPLQGNHRIATLVASGKKYILAGTLPGYHRKIKYIANPSSLQDLDHNACVSRFVEDEV